MRTITKDIEIPLDGSRVGFRLFKLDAFSGMVLLRYLLRLEEGRTGGEGKAPTVLDLIASLSEEELKGVLRSVLCHVQVLLPAGPHPVMTGSEWGYPDLEHDLPACLRLLVEGISWSLSGFFGGGQSGESGGTAPTSP